MLFFTFSNSSLFVALAADTGLSGGGIGGSGEVDWGSSTCEVPCEVPGDATC